MDRGFRLFSCFAAKKRKAGICILKKRLKLQENEKGERHYAEASAAADPHGISGHCLRSVAQNRTGLTKYGPGKEKITNDKLNLDSKDVIGVLLAAAAALICAMIDYFAEEDNEHD